MLFFLFHFNLIESIYVRYTTFSASKCMHAIGNAVCGKCQMPECQMLMTDDARRQYAMKRPPAPASSSRHQKAQQTPDRKPPHEHQPHEPAGRLPLLDLDPQPRAHHARRAQEPVAQPEEELHRDEVEGVAGDEGARAADVAEEIQRDEDDAGGAQAEHGPGPEREAVEVGKGGEEPAGEVACVPEEEGERDEAGWLEEPGYGVVVVDADDLLREDGEEHCQGEGDEEGGGEGAEFAEEGPEADDFAGRGVRGGLMVGRVVRGGRGW